MGGGLVFTSFSKVQKIMWYLYIFLKKNNSGKSITHCFKVKVKAEHYKTKAWQIQIKSWVHFHCYYIIGNACVSFVNLTIFWAWWISNVAKLSPSQDNLKLSMKTELALISLHWWEEGPKTDDRFGCMTILWKI